MSTRLKPYRSTHTSVDISADTRPILDRHPVESRSICRPSSGRHSVYILAKCRSIYRPIVSTDTTYSRKHDSLTLLSRNLILISLSFHCYHCFHNSLVDCTKEAAVHQHGKKKTLENSSSTLLAEVISSVMAL